MPAGGPNIVAETTCTGKRSALPEQSPLAQCGSGTGQEPHYAAGRSSVRRWCWRFIAWSRRATPLPCADGRPEMTPGAECTAPSLESGGCVRPAGRELTTRAYRHAGASVQSRLAAASVRLPIVAA